MFKTLESADRVGRLPHLRAESPPFAVRCVVNATADLTPHADLISQPKQRGVEILQLTLHKCVAALLAFAPIG